MFAIIPNKKNTNKVKREDLGENKIKKSLIEY